MDYTLQLAQVKSSCTRVNVICVMVRNYAIDEITRKFYRKVSDSLIIVNLENC